MSDLLPMFYEEKSISADAFPETPDFAFDFRATGTIIRVDGPGDIQFSLDGDKVHGRLKATDFFAAMDFVDFSRIWLRKVGPEPCNVRFWAWVNQ